MKINQINKYSYFAPSYTAGKTKKSSNPISVQQSVRNNSQKIPVEYYKSSLYNLAFKGSASEIQNAYIISDKEDNIPLMATEERHSYIIDYDSQSEVIYGKHAKKFLDSNDEFEYDTQILFPQKASGTLCLKNGKTIELAEGASVVIKAGTKAKIKDIKGYPAVIMVKQDYSWYEHYTKDAKDTNIRNKFLELMYCNSFLYNGNFSPDVTLPIKLRNEAYLKNLGINKWESKNKLPYKLFEVKDKLPEEDRKIVETAKSALDKLFACGITEENIDGYINVKQAYCSEYLEKYLQENGFSEEEIKIVTPIIQRTRQTRKDSRIAIASPASMYREDLIPRLKQAHIFLDNKKNLDTVYWTVLFPNETSLRNKLKEVGFNQEEEDSVVESWYKTNLSGYDISGLKYIDSNVAIYNLSDKLNNWTQEETNWLTNSTELTSTQGDTPFIGTSFVTCEDDDIVPIDKIRQGEVLHSHPGLEDKRQSEIYLITDGACALTVVKNDNPKINVLNKGDLVVVGPRVKHCVNSVGGKYEHLAIQVPSAFQYGFSFKRPEEFPEGYNPSVLDEEAREKLSALK